MKTVRLIVKILCVIIAAAIICTAIFFRNNGVNVVSVKAESNICAEAVCADIPEERYKKICSSGHIELYFDEITTSVMIKETTENKKWYSMPQNSKSSSVSIKVRADDGIHCLNSQNNSVEFSSFKYKQEKDGITVNYTMAENKETALKKIYNKSDIVYGVNLSIKLKDGNLYVTSEYNNLSGNQNCGVIDICPFEYFGAYKNAGIDDFLLIPDGCGGAIYPYYESDTKNFSCKVYGNDYSVSSENNNYAPVGSFGMKNGESAFAAVIDSGEDFAEIKAVSSNENFNTVSAHFSADYVKSENDKLYIFQNENNKSGICYKFLSKGNATYTDIALACREQLIRNGTLSVTSAESDEDMPLFVTLTGAYKTGARKLKYNDYTTFSQAEDIIKRIKSKGINNINIRYNNVFENNSADVLSVLGNKEDLQKLNEYALSQNVKIYFNLNVLTYSSPLGRADLFASRGMNKFPLNIEKSIDMYGFGKANTRAYKMRTLDKANAFVDKIADKASTLNVTGYCFGDSGKFLCSDFSPSGVKRTDYKNGIINHISAIQNTGKVMIDTGNIYTVKNASSVINIPMTVSYPETDAYCKIPFIQTILHGMTVLASPPLNSTDNIKTSVLNCIEYGVCPDFTTVYTQPEDAEYRIEYNSIANGINSAYNKIAPALKSLEGERISEHKKISDGVFCTTYGNGTRIYVNYNSFKVTVNGVTVSGSNYLRID